MPRKGPHEGIDEITASIDAVLADYDEGGLGWSKDGYDEPRHLSRSQERRREIISSFGPDFDEVHHWPDGIDISGFVFLNGRPLVGARAITMTTTATGEHFSGAVAYVAPADLPHVGDTITVTIEPLTDTEQENA